MLFFLSMRYNEGRPVSSILRLTDKFTERLLLKWSEPAVWMALVLSGIFTALFLTVEFFIAPEPILPSFLLNQKIPVLIGCSNALVAVCNLSVTYFFPIWFQTVMLSSASTAGGPFQHHCLGYQLIRGMGAALVTKQCLYFYGLVFCRVSWNMHSTFLRLTPWDVGG